VPLTLLPMLQPPTPQPQAAAQAAVQVGASLHSTGRVSSDVSFFTSSYVRATCVHPLSGRTHHHSLMTLSLLPPLSITCRVSLQALARGPPGPSTPS
jgi:hypothetical protein